MNNHAPADLTEQVSAAFDWWREAGVDCDFQDAPADWLASRDAAPAAAVEGRREAPAPSARDAEPAATAEAPIDRSSMPDDLAAFREWWLAEPTLDDGRVAGRVPPRGSANPELMVLVPEPEEGDTDTLLAGAEGRLLAAILDAMGIAPEAAYVASALPRHTPLADWTRARTRGLDVVVSHHVALARPKRLIVFGSNILPLVRHDPAQEADVSPQFNHGGQIIPLFAARSLAALLERSRWKAAFWRGWLDWTSGDGSSR